MNNQWRDNAHRMVIWADGTYDTSRVCDECGLETCHDPVHTDRYKEVGQARIEETDGDANLGYWDFLQVFGAGRRDHDGEMVYEEPLCANPDGLPEPFPRLSGVSEETHELVQQAFSALTPKQQQVWQLVMREQVSQTEAANRLNISQPMVKKHLNYAKAKFIEILRSGQENVGA